MIGKFHDREIGKFEVHITTGDVELDLSTLCKRFSLPEIIQLQTALECDKGMRGDTILSFLSFLF